MKAMNLKLNLLLVFALAMFGAALAQDDIEVSTVGAEEFVAVGGIEVLEPEPYDAAVEEVDVAVETGAIVFTADTPEEQHPNVDLVGPDDYVQHLEIDDEDEQVVEGLLPGIYSVAATDDGRQLAHALVEVMPGRAVRVNITLDEPALAGFEDVDMLADDRFVYPDDAFEVGEPFAFDEDEFGAIMVETDNESANFVVTGPDGYSETFEGAFTAEDLEPGIYVVVGTDDASRIATSTFRVDVATATTLVPVFDVVAETEVIDGEVAGGAEAGAVDDAADADPVEESDPVYEPVDGAAEEDAGM